MSRVWQKEFKGRSYSELRKTNPKEQTAIWTFSPLVDLNEFSPCTLWLYGLHFYLPSHFFFLQTTAPQELCLIALSSTEISSVLLGLSSHGLHESSLTCTVRNYYENINQGQNSKDSFGLSEKPSERELKWRQHSVTVGFMSEFLQDSTSICNFGWHVTTAYHMLWPVADTCTSW